MDGNLSQEELDALLANLTEEQNNDQGNEPELFSSNEIDAIGEIANICAGSSATNLSAVLNQRVNITTPEVRVASMNDLIKDIVQPCLVVKVNYIEGILGCNIQILHENDAKVITDLMLGGDGNSLSMLGDEITDLHMSALCEAMNQMTGACATSFNTMLGRRVDISPPTASFVDLREQSAFEEAFDMKQNDKVVIVSFKFEVGTLIDSTFIQIYTVDFAKELYKIFEENNKKQQEKSEQEKAASQPVMQNPVMQQQQMPQQQMQPQQMSPQQEMDISLMGMNSMGMQQGMISPGGNNVFGYDMTDIQEVDILPAHFSKFDPLIRPLEQREKIDVIDDVSLEITVELGKTQKSIQEILDFEEGSLVELNRFTGEMMDILVNGKVIAKGEVVVLEDRFAVQLKEINVNEEKSNKRRSKAHR